MCTFSFITVALEQREGRPPRSQLRYQHHGQQPTIQRPAAKGFRELPKGRGFHSLGLSHQQAEDETEPMSPDT